MTNISQPITGGDSKTNAIYLGHAAGSVPTTAINDLQTLTGITFNAIETFCNPMPDWSSWENPWQFTSYDWQAWLNGAPGRQLIFGMDLVPWSETGTDTAPVPNPYLWEQKGAAGQYNFHYTALAQNMVNWGLFNNGLPVVIRLGIEANGNWEADWVGNTAQERTAWAQTFSNCVTSMRFVPGTNFLFCWNPNAGYSVGTMDLASWYPGDAYVDIVGIDQYDLDAQNGQTALQEGWTALANNTNGTNSTNQIIAFANAHSKPIAYGEWGLNVGYPDDAVYVNGLAGTVHNNPCAFQCYFSSGTAGISPLGNSFPDTLAAYIAQFGGTGSGPAFSVAGHSSVSINITGAGAPGNAMNANPGFESGTAPNIANGPTAILSQSAAWAASGTYSGRVTVSGTGGYPGLRSEDISVSPNVSYTISMTANSTGLDLQWGVRWLDSGGGYISQDFGEDTLVASTPQALSAVYTSPNTAAYAQVFAQVDPQMTVAQWFAVDLFQLALVSPGINFPVSGSGNVQFQLGSQVSIPFPIYGIGSTALLAGTVGTTPVTLPESGSGNVQLQVVPASASVGIADSGSGNADLRVSGTSTAFPGKPIPAKAEILINGAWANISEYVQLRTGVNITGMGRADWTNTIQAGQMTLTLNNRDGRFTPKNASGAYYPYILRNTQFRFSIDAALSSTGVGYTGYRFWGEVSEWPPLWDETGRDVWVTIIVSGAWRRISQSTGPGDGNNIGSPFKRYIKNLTGTRVPASYWSLEDGGGSTAFVTNIGAGAHGTFVGDPSFSSDGTSFTGSDAIPQFNGSRINMSVSGGGTPTNNVMWFLLMIPRGGDSQQGQNNWCILEADTGSAAVPIIEVYISSMPGSVGKLIFQGRTASTIRWTTTTTNSVRGIPLLVSMELTPSGGNIAWALRLIRPGDGSVWESKTGTYNTASIGAITSVKLNRSGKLSDTAIGHVSAFYAVPSLTAAATALAGHNGETASARFTRLCTEFGIASEITGLSSAQMGPQRDDTFVNLLQKIEDTDGGLIYEPRGLFGLGYRTLASIKDQSVALSLNYATAQVSPPMAPAFDDMLVKNQVTVANWTGYTMVATLNSGAVSIAQPPNGVGIYADQQDINAYADSQASAIATQRLFNGTVDDLRYPGITVELSRPEVAPLFATIPGMKIGDRVQVPNMPSFMGGGTLDQLAWGYSETITNYTWNINFNTIAAAPYITGFNPGAYTVVRAPSSTPVTGSSGSVTGAMLGRGAVGIPELASTVNSRTIGGNTSYTSATIPYSWTFVVSGVPADATYFICSQDQAQPIAVGDSFTNSSGFGGPFTVTSISDADVSGNVSVYFDPDASGVMSSGTVSGSKNGDLWINTGADNKLYQWKDGVWTQYQFGPTALSFTAGGTKVTIANSAPSSPATGDVWFDGANGYEMKSWTGSVWTPFQFGSTSISDNAITTPKLNAGAVIAEKIAAGTIFAGIVDGTTVESAYFIAGAGGGTAWQAATPSVPGFFLYWDDGVADPDIIFAVSAATGSDQWGNTWQGGATFVGLSTLLNVFTVQDPTTGDALITMDYAGNLQAVSVSAQDVFVGGDSVAESLAAEPYGVVNYGYIDSNPWPGSPLSSSATALFELDQDVVADRLYEFVMYPTSIRSSVAGATVALSLHYTTDGSIPTTSSPTATYVGKILGAANSGDSHPGLSCLFGTSADGTYRFLVAGAASSGTWYFTQDPYIRCVVRDVGTTSLVNNMNPIGSGTSGGSSAQTYTEYFYPLHTYSYYTGGPSLRGTDISMYHGAYSGESDYQMAYIQWDVGSRGHGLNTVLNYSVHSVKLRLRCLHSWYNSGMRFGIHSSTALGSLAYTGITSSHAIAEGATTSFNLSSADWTPFKAGGITFMVLCPDAGNQHNLGWYGYFWGGGGTSTSTPRLAVNYTH